MRWLNVSVHKNNAIYTLTYNLWLKCAPFLSSLFCYYRGVSREYKTNCFPLYQSLSVFVYRLRFTRSRWTCDTAELLIRHGCDIRAVDNEGNTPLHRTAESDRDDIANILLDRGAEIGALDWQGSTPLHVAAACNAIRVTTLLVKSGANTRALGSEGRTPLDIAYKCGNHEIVDLFEEQTLQSNGRWYDKDFKFLPSSMMSNCDHTCLVPRPLDFAVVNRFGSRGVSVHLTAPECIRGQGLEKSLTGTRQ